MPSPVTTDIRPSHFSDKSRFRQAFLAIYAVTVLIRSEPGGGCSEIYISFMTPILQAIARQTFMLVRFNVCCLFVPVPGGRVGLKAVRRGNRIFLP